MNTEQQETPNQAPLSESQLRVPSVTTSNVPLAAAAGAAASIVGAVVWAVVTVSTKMQIGWMAVGVGFLVGYAVGRFNHSGEKVFGYIGASLALFGCLLGNLFSIFGFLSVQEDVSIIQVLTQVDYSAIPGVMAESFSPMDLLFYGIAVYEGFKFAAKPKVG